MQKPITLLFAGLAALSFAACDDEPPQDTNQPDVIDEDGVEEPGPTIAGQGTDEGVAAFPDDRLTTEDSSTPTGLRVTYNGSNDASLPNDIMRGLADQVAELDGFGTTAGGWIRFNERLDAETVTTGPATTELDSNVIVGAFDGDELEVVPVEVTVTVAPPQLLYRPMLPLPSNAQAFVALTRDILDTHGNAIEPTEELSAILAGDNPAGSEAVAPAIREVADALEGAGYLSGADELAALYTFTTQSVIEVDLAIAETISNAGLEVKSYEGCVTLANYRQCDITFDVPNFIDETNLTIDEENTGDPGETYELDARLFLPLEDAGVAQPYPTCIFGHGLTGNRTDADEIARYAAPAGVAVIAIDAPQHGNHPLAQTPGSSDELDIILPLFGIQLEGKIGIDGFALRDGWRHSNFDKLALIEVIRDGIDTDEDGTADLDIDQLTYLGGSLGAIQGSELLALSRDLSAGLLAVGGARLVDIVQFSDLFAPIIRLLLTGAPPSDLLRFYVLLQTLVERGDGANWAPFVLQDRLNDGPIPEIAAQMSIPDEVVANVTNIYLARALGLSFIGEVVMPDPFIGSEQAPVSGNHPSGVTAVMLQTDFITRNGSVVAAQHSTGPTSDEAIEFWIQALTTHYEGAMTLDDPYETLGTVRP